MEAVLPKAELHAHLHGSIRDATLVELLTANGSSASLAAMRILRETAHQRSLSDCFALFDSIHSVVTTREAVERIARETVSDFALDGVRYLELRTTPRRDVMSAREYVDAIERGVLRATPRCVVRLLLSINRAQSVADAEATVDLAIELHGAGTGRVVGVDLSGNPTLGEFASFEPALRRARAHGLNITVHCAEVVKPAEVRAIEAFAPDRLGHALHLPRDVLAKLLARDPGARIPIEICPTSNMHTLQLSSLDAHPTLATWLRESYPIAICTDDAGVFATSPSDELRRVADAFALSPHQLARLAAAPFAQVFADARTAPDVDAMLRDVARAYTALGFAACGASVLACAAQRSAL